MKSHKKDQRGITHNLMLAGIAVLVLGAVGFAGFRVYKSNNDINAKAAGWTTVASSGGLEIKACATTNGLGRVYFLNRSSYDATLPFYGNYKVKANSNSSVLGSSNGVMWQMTNGRSSAAYKMNSSGLSRC